MNAEWKVPDYRNCLVNLAGSILTNFGADTSSGTLALADPYLSGGHRNVVLLLLDAMGTGILEKHLDESGFFRTNLAGSYDSVYPPTTVAATTSVLSGLCPNEHGWLGWDMYYPALSKNVTVFTNTDQLCEREDAEPAAGPDGKKIWDEDSLAQGRPAADFHAGFTLTPYRNIVDRIKDAGGNAFFSMPYLPPFPEDLDSVLERIQTLCGEPGRKFIYAYWNEPDTTMHRTGTDSRETHDLVISLEKRIETFASGLSDTLLLVTADHGHIDGRNLCILDYPEVMDCLVRLPSIEPRTLNLFVKKDRIVSFPEIFRKNFGEDFLLLTREEVLSSRLFGTGTDRPGLSQMIGDYVAVAVSDMAIFNTHYESQTMAGAHAGMTEEEYRIPLIVIEGRT